MSIKKVIYLEFLILCLSATIDTKLFVYSSLSKLLFEGICTILLSLSALTYYIAKRNIAKSINIGKLDVYVILWIIFLLFHNLVIPSEKYHFLFLITSLILHLTLSFILRHHLLSFHHIGNGLLLIAIIHLVFCSLQILGCIKSTSHYFNITGCNDNPNITAIYLVGCIPIIVHRITHSKKNKSYLMLLLIAFYFIIILKCRTAFIGLFVMYLTMFLFMFQNRRKLKIIVLIITLIVSPFIAHKCYEIKKNSADGRLLIWKITIGMVTEKPFGYGYGLFERNYNLAQANYFEMGNGTLQEKQNAAVVSMPYNDYLEHTVEGGLLGLFFYSGFLAIISYITYIQQRKYSFALILSFVIMATCNFIYTSFQPWLLLLCFAAKVDEDNYSIKLSLKQSKVCITVCLVGILWCGAKNLVYAISQHRLYQLQKKPTKILTKTEMSELTTLEVFIGSSEAYWQFRGYCNIVQNQYEKALLCYEIASNYTTTLSLYFHLFQCYYNLGKTDDAIRVLKRIKCMQPTNLRSRHLLMHYYYEQKDYKTALEFANEIIQVPIKVESEKTREIKYDAMKLFELTKKSHI